MLSAPVVRVARVLGVAAACALIAVQALAIQPTSDTRTFRLSEGFVWADYEAHPSLVIHEAGKAGAPAEMARFLGDQGGRWEVRWDTRNERPHLVQGSGIPLLPGSGNHLTSRQAASRGGKATLADVERLVRGFMARYPELFRIAAQNLRLDTTRSRSYGPGDRVWFVELQQFHEGVPVDGANVFFRINNGNIVQFGADRIADVGISAQPALSAADARQRALDTPRRGSGRRVEGARPGHAEGLSGPHRGRALWREVRGPGGLRLLPPAGVGDRRSAARTTRARTRSRSTPRRGALLRAWDLNTYATVSGRHLSDDQHRSRGASARSRSRP